MVDPKKDRGYYLDRGVEEVLDEGTARFRALLLSRTGLVLQPLVCGALFLAVLQRLLELLPSVREDVLVPFQHGLESARLDRGLRLKNEPLCREAADRQFAEEEQVVKSRDAFQKPLRRPLS